MGALAPAPGVACHIRAREGRGWHGTRESEIAETPRAPTIWRRRSSGLSLSDGRAPEGAAPAAAGDGKVRGVSVNGASSARSHRLTRVPGEFVRRGRATLFRRRIHAR